MTLSKLQTVLTEHLKLILSPVIINGFLFFDEKGNIRNENWGDDINYYFLREIIDRPVVFYNRTSLAFRLKLRNFLVIGSTIDMLSKPNTEVWGAGIINPDSKLSYIPKKIHAVRGPLTRQNLLSRGISCPEIYGDPALLISRYYTPKTKKKYRFGLISHVSNLAEVNKLTIDGTPIARHPDVLIINLSSYRHWRNIIDQICSCEAILSSSLHGLIIAESYGIPNLWIEFGKPLIGGHFKFHDFFLSIGRDRPAPMSITDNNLSFSSLNESLSVWQKGYIHLEPLIAAAPFPLKSLK